MYAITARHVIDGLRSHGITNAVLRLNPRSADAPLITISIPLDKWVFHPTDNSIDVATTEMGIPPEADHLVWPYSLCANDKTFADNEVELGEEVFVSGLFKHHFGSNRNIPIVRIGFLAALDEEKISSDDFGEIDGYLIDARATPGLSGSPVFLNLGNIRSVGGELKHAPGKKLARRTNVYVAILVDLKIAA
jgi:hypothetical protein